MAILGFASCKKDDNKPEAYAVKYNVSCASCSVTYTNAYGFTKTEVVNGSWFVNVPNFGVQNATIDITEVSPSNIVSSITVNGVDHGNKFGPGKYTVQVK